LGTEDQVTGAPPVVAALFDGGTNNTEPVDPRIQQESDVTVVVAPFSPPFGQGNIDR